MSIEAAQSWKEKGNKAFGENDIEAAVSAYSQGIVQCDRLLTTATDASSSSNASPEVLKSTLLSNRAMCRLKNASNKADLQACIDDCSTGLNVNTTLPLALRSKLYYRRAKARFLLANIKDNNSNLLQDAAKDLLTLLQDDPKNDLAQQLLSTIRAQHKSSSNSPVAQTVQKLSSESNNVNHNLKVLMGLLDNDLSNASMELGRRTNGVEVLFQLASNNVLALQCLSQAGSYPLFARTFLVVKQERLYNLIKTTTTTNLQIIVSALSVYMRIILNADRDDPNQEITGTTLLDYNLITQSTEAALQYALTNTDQMSTIVRAVLDVWTTWTAGINRETSIRQAHDDLPLPATQADIRAMAPRELAAYRQRQLASKTRDEAWAFERSIQILSSTKLLQESFLAAATATQDHVLRREMTVVLGRLLANLQDDDKIKQVVKPILMDESQEGGVIIEELHNDDDEEAKTGYNDDDNSSTLQTKMYRAMITAALLLSKQEIGAWALQHGWTNSSDELPDLINSGHIVAMCLASEVLSSAATVEASRPLVANITSSGAMEKLLMSDDRDIRSGAASAVAKLGLSTKTSDEGEVMGMLQAACDLLEDDDNGEKEVPAKKEESKLRHFSSFATSSVERAIEMITYLIAQTIVKDELAAGFHSRPGSSHSALDLLVKTTSLPNSGESLSGFGLATIFQHMAATNLQLRKEAFKGKEVTMEQYDEMQKLGKTEEEKEVLDSQQDPDTTAACNERIRKMASANVPRALVTLSEGASEHTLEQVVLALSRMASEASVRGLMIQQGVLSACIKLEKSEGPTETDVMKQAIQLARHTIAKLLITTNPSLLTSAQRLGSIRPLIQLVRDHKATDLMHFEALLALTNIASTGDDAKTRIISEKGIGSLHFAMFSDHEMVRRAATEAMCNLVPNKDMMEHLAATDNLRLWLAFSCDYEENYECARAASGCLAMATQDGTIAETLVDLPKFKLEMSSLMESGRLEIMHRAFVIVMNLIMHGGKCKEKAISEGLVAFCSAYADSYNNKDGSDLDFPEEEQQILPVTIKLAKQITALSNS